MIELVAAAWRFLAVTKPENTRGLQALLVKVMEGYLKAQGVRVANKEGPSEEVRKELARRILVQWEGKNLSARILVPSNPRAPKG